MTKYSRRAAALLLTSLFASPVLADGHTTHTVVISGFAFEPASLTIAAGDAVVFVNEDGAPHTATSTQDLFDTGRLSRGQEATLTFPGAGTFDYFCAIHPSMTGQITVQ